MFVHSVYFWLKEGLADKDRADFRKGLESLKAVGCAQSVFVGVPASTNRPVVDASYDFALVVAFADQAAHDAYQVDPIHKEFVRKYSDKWDAIVVFDAV